MAEAVRPAVADLTALLAHSDLSPEALDEALEVTPGTVRSWRDGLAKIPKKYRDVLASMRASADYEAKVLDLALPECATERQLGAVMMSFPIEESLGEEGERAFERWTAHKRDCPVCRSNDERKERELGKHPLILGMTRNMRLSIALNTWGSRPWTLILTLPPTVLCLWLAFHQRGPDAGLLQGAYAILGAFFAKFVVAGSITIWHRLRNGSHD